SYIVTINQHMDAIATSAREQSVGLSEVNTAVNQMDQVTQQNAAMVEEANAASATLAAEVERLRSIVSGFRMQSQLSQSSAREILTASAPPRPASRRPIKAAGGGAALSVVGTESWQDF
ncbi:methyl-accepting chemotaxis protein, partial [Rhizobium sp. YIM 134829]